MADDNFGVQQIADHAKRPIGYHIRDIHTGNRVGKGRTLRGSTNAAERRNQEYGAHRYSTRPVYNEEDY